MVILEVSIFFASTAGTNGDSLRLESRSSLSCISFKTLLSDVECPKPKSYSYLLRALISAEALIKNFISASGHITVPISRPSKTAPPGCEAKLL